MTAYPTLLSLASVADQRAFPFLTVLVLVPVGAALLALMVPKRASWVIRGVGLAASVGVLGLAAAVLDEFQAGVGGYQMVSQHPWVGSLGISWNLGVDGISLFLVLLTALLFVLALAGAGERSNVKAFTVWILLLEAACLGSFLSLDLLMFFLFFETTLVPIYFIIGGWGHERRNHAAMKFFIYTFTGSAVMLVGILALVSIHQGQTGVTTFDIRQLAETRLSGTAGVLLLLAFSAAFAVKAPIFPFHTWSPDAYREAPVAGSVLLAGVTAKLGTYGIIRFDLGLFPHATVVLAPLFLTLGVVGIIYGAIVAAVQKDLKRLVAYSSLANIGFIVIGAFALTGEAVSGAVLQMLNHGLVTAALFLLVAMIHKRRQTMSVAHLGGLQHKAPIMAATFTVVALASIGVPGLNSFVGEFLILSGSMQSSFANHHLWTAIAATGVILSAAYMLRMIQRVFYCDVGPRPQAVAGWDLDAREHLALWPMVALFLAMGLFSPLWMRAIDTYGVAVSSSTAATAAALPSASPQITVGGARR